MCRQDCLLLCRRRCWSRWRFCIHRPEMGSKCGYTILHSRGDYQLSNTDQRPICSYIESGVLSEAACPNKVQTRRFQCRRSFSVFVRLRFHNMYRVSEPLNIVPLFSPAHTPVIPEPRKQEIVLFVGYPGVGKSTICERYFVSKGYEHINQVHNTRSLTTWTH